MTQLCTHFSPAPPPPRPRQAGPAAAASPAADLVEAPSASTNQIHERMNSRVPYLIWSTHVAYCKVGAVAIGQSRVGAPSRERLLPAAAVVERVVHQAVEAARALRDSRGDSSTADAALLAIVERVIVLRLRFEEGVPRMKDVRRGERAPGGTRALLVPPQHLLKRKTFIEICCRNGIFCGKHGWAILMLNFKIRWE